MDEELRKLIISAIEEMVEFITNDEEAEVPWVIVEIRVSRYQQFPGTPQNWVVFAQVKPGEMGKSSTFRYAWYIDPERGLITADGF